MNISKTNFDNYVTLTQIRKMNIPSISRVKKETLEKLLEKKYLKCVESPWGTLYLKSGKSSIEEIQEKITNGELVVKWHTGEIYEKVL